MILLYLTGTLLLVTALAIAIGRLVQAQDDYRYERMLWHDDPGVASARMDMIRAWAWVLQFSAVLLAWIAWLVWGSG